MKAGKILNDAMVVLFAVLIGLAFVSCQEKKDRPTEPETEVAEPDTTGLEEVQTLELYGELIEPENRQTASLDHMGLPFEAFEHTDSAYLYQGDILIDKRNIAEVYEKDQVREMPPRKATARTKGFWPNNTMYYQINPQLPETTKTRIKGAMNWFLNNSNIKFVEEAHSGGHVYFTTGSGCSSYIGKTGYRQNITVASGCSTGNIVHEIFHALGFWHEQSRGDRDKHVKIMWENVASGYQHNFRTYAEQRMDGQDFGTEMDFGSILMYPSHSFSATGKPTIVKLDGTTYRTQRSAPSAADKAALNELYPEPEPEKPEEPAEPEYENGKTYLIEGIWVYRSAGKWYYYNRSLGWKQVKLSSQGYWYYA